MTANAVIERILSRNKTLILDGGMGQELLHRGIADDPVLWSATALTDNAHVVMGLHEDYLSAGANIITTNSYATNLYRFRQDGNRDRFQRLNHLAGQLARQVATDSGRDDVLVAASLPPMRGSYRPDQVPGYQQMLDEYTPQAEILSDYVDVFLCETVSCAQEGRAAAEAALSVAGQRPVWVSWTLEDGGSDRLRSGESLNEAVAAVADMRIGGYLVNCCSPESVTAAMPALCAFEVAVKGAYANGFVEIPENWLIGDGADVLGKRVDLDPGQYARHVSEWIAAGANLVGGCCEIGPPHIAALRELLANPNER